MSEPLPGYNSDDYDTEGQDSERRFDILRVRHDGSSTTQSFRDLDPALYDHLSPQSPPSPFITPSSPIPQTPTFFSMSNPGTPGSRRLDAFYELPPKSTRSTVYFAFHVAPPAATQPPTNGEISKATQRDIPTVIISTRLIFPTRRNQPNAFLWENVHRRDEAAEWINTNLCSLYTRGLLSACVAGDGYKTLNSLMEGDGKSFRLHIGSFLRYDDFAPASDSSPDKTAGPANPTNETPERASVKVGETNSSLAIREMKADADISSWTTGDLYPKLEGPYACKPLPSNRRATVIPEQVDALREMVEQSIASQDHITNQGICCLGNVTLCGPDAMSTIASSSTAAAN